VSNDLFESGDQFDDPAWRKVKPRSSKGPWIGCSLSWFEWVVPLVKSKWQLAFAQLLYRRCCICKSATITVPTEAFDILGISRHGKRRFLLALEQVGIIRVEETRRGRLGKITLINWPEPA
jgi:hypothetical protein